MGRRKEPQALEELRAEIEFSKTQIELLDHQAKLKQKQYETQARKERTRRLCKEAGILEHFVPELKEMNEQDAAELIRLAATSREAIGFLKEKGLRDNEETNHEEG